MLKHMFAATCLVTVPAAAGPLNPGLVARDATLVVHLDVEAGAGSAVGRFLLQDQAQVRLALAEAKAELGLDPSTDLKGLTVYSTREDAHEGVVIVVATPAVDALIEGLRTDERYEQIDEDGLVIHRWTEQGQVHYATVRRAGAGDQRLVFIARAQEDLRAGLRVADGEAPSMAGPEAPEPAAGSILFVRALRLPSHLKRDKGASAFLRKVEGMIVDVGERQGELFADVTLTASTTEDADTLVQAARGLLAMGRLMAMHEEGASDLNRVLDSLRLSIEGKRLTATWRFDSGAMINAIRASLSADVRRTSTDAPGENQERRDPDR